MQALNYDLAATALADAAINGDQQAIQRAQISIRALQRYRQRLAIDPKLAQYVAEKKAALLGRWADSLPSAARECIAFIDRAARDADHKDPAAVVAIAGAFKLLTEADMNRKVLDVYLAELAVRSQAIAGSVPHALPRDAGRTISVHAQPA